MKRKTIKEMMEEINKEEEIPQSYITGDEFESWLKVQKDIDLFYIRCPKCGEPLNKYYETEDVRGLCVKQLIFIKCPKCGEVYSGYECKVVDDKVVYFKLIK